MNGSDKQQLSSVDIRRDISFRYVLDELSEFLKNHCQTSVSVITRFICRSIYLENLGVVEEKVVEDMVFGKTPDEESLLYQDTFGFVKGYQYLYTLSQCKDAGLLDNNLILELHKIVMNHRRRLCTVGKYSIRDRLVEFKGKIHFYPSVWNMEESMQILIDQYNHRWFVINKVKKADHRTALEDLIHLVSWLVCKFLELHPFGDGNGRTIRLLYSYTMESFGVPLPVTLLWCSDKTSTLKHYEQWCDLLENIQTKQDFIRLEQCMILSLKMSLLENVSVSK